MKLKQLMTKGLLKIKAFCYCFIDGIYVALDRTRIRRTRNIRLIPKERDRRGGKHSYAEWAHVIGIFQAVIFYQLKDRKANTVLDIGCGTGLLGIASEPYVANGGKYIGLDVMQNDINFCQSHYLMENYSFIHFPANNSAYAPHQKSQNNNWPIESGSIDLVTALSVWTHLKEEDAIFYFEEINRVLNNDGAAIITFFLLDDYYKECLTKRTNKQSQFNMTRPNKWRFTNPVYGSDAWFSPKWAEIPETAIGITEDGLDRLLQNTNLRLVEHHPGNWKEMPGMFFQDILVFRKIIESA